MTNIRVRGLPLSLSSQLCFSLAFMSVILTRHDDTFPIIFPIMMGGDGESGVVRGKNRPKYKDGLE